MGSLAKALAAADAILKPQSLRIVDGSLEIEMYLEKTGGAVGARAKMVLRIGSQG